MGDVHSSYRFRILKEAWYPWLRDNGYHSIYLWFLEEEQGIELKRCLERCRGWGGFWPGERVVRVLHGIMNSPHSDVARFHREYRSPQVTVRETGSLGSEFDCRCVGIKNVGLNRN